MIFSFIYDIIRTIYVLKVIICMKNICCFAGHSRVYSSEKVYEKVLLLAETLICDQKVSEFRVGNYGGFDALCTRAIRELKNKYPHIVLILVIPYLTNDINEYKNYYNETYDAILIAQIPESTPKKFQIIKANQYMVDKSQFMICCIDHEWGGAFKTLEYAKRKKYIKIYNIANA